MQKRVQNGPNEAGMCKYKGKDEGTGSTRWFLNRSRPGFQIPRATLKVQLRPKTEEPSRPSHHIDQCDLYCDGPRPGLTYNFSTIYYWVSHCAGLRKPVWRQEINPLVLSTYKVNVLNTKVADYGLWIDCHFCTVQLKPSHTLVTLSSSLGKLASHGKLWVPRKDPVYKL